MYDFVELEGGDDEPLWEQASYQTNTESEREWSKLSDQFVNAGYREGITAGKESELQTGFECGFKDIGAPVGRDLGNLRGLAAGVLSFMESSQPSTPKLGDKGELLAEVRAIIKGLERLQFAKLAPPDEEALAHAREHAELNGEDSQAPENTALATDLPELSLLRRRLRNVFEVLELDGLQ